MKHTLPLPPPKSAFALRTLFAPSADVFARRRGSIRRASVTLGIAVLLTMACPARAANLAPLGNGIMGFTASVTETNLGTLLFHAYQV